MPRCCVEILAKPGSSDVAVYCHAHSDTAKVAAGPAVKALGKSDDAAVAAATFGVVETAAATLYRQVYGTAPAPGQINHYLRDDQWQEGQH